MDRLGATPHEDGSCSFLVWAPWARRVRVRLRTLEREQGEGGRVRREDLTKAERGYWWARVEAVRAGDRYAYMLDDVDQELPDPASASQPEGVHGCSQVVDHGAFEWTDHQWRGRPVGEYVLYELHVGTFTPDGTFDAAIGRLDALAADGITAIELLPVGEFPGGRNWGYDGVDLFAPQSTYGGPDGLRRLVDAAHARGICVVLDVVYNHLGPEGNYLQKFGPYFAERYRTPWGDAMNVDGQGSDEVRRFFIENALQWTRDYHVDALRLDAIHGIVDMSAQPFLAEFTAAIVEHAARQDRHVLTFAESDLNDARVITRRDAGGLGFDAQWTDDFHHALHVALTGETRGYFADYQDGIEMLATSLREGFVYTGQYSEHRQRRFGTPAPGLPGDRFVVYAQNHDQVGNRLLGDRLAARLPARMQRVALAAVLLSPFVPMLFMGEEYGETRPFPYFTSHADQGLVDAVRRGRADEFRHFGFEGDPADPQDQSTFEAAVLDWEARHRGHHAELLAFTRELLRLRREHPSIRTMPAPEDVTASGRVLAIERHRGDERTRLVLDFDAGDVTLELLDPGSEVLMRVGGTDE